MQDFIKTSLPETEKLFICNYMVSTLERYHSPMLAEFLSLPFSSPKLTNSFRSGRRMIIKHFCSIVTQACGNFLGSVSGRVPFIDSKAPSQMQLHILNVFQQIIFLVLVGIITEQRVALLFQ